MGSIEDLTLEAFKHEFSIDVDGVFLGCKYGIGLMKKQGGSIINMSSAAGIKASPLLCAYNGAKGAVNMMTKSIALYCAEQKNNIRCNSVHPGAIHTEIIDKTLAQSENPDELMATFVASHPVGHLGVPGDIASIVSYLASDESSFATGSQFVVDGGMTL
jgi:3(or 17)beta-hydroxysteroid dehydrogenase